MGVAITPCMTPHSKARAWNLGEGFMHLFSSMAQAFGGVVLSASLCQPVHIYNGYKAS